MAWWRRVDGGNALGVSSRKDGSGHPRGRLIGWGERIYACHRGGVFALMALAACGASRAVSHKPISTAAALAPSATSGRSGGGGCAGVSGDVEFVRHRVADGRHRLTASLDSTPPRPAQRFRGASHGLQSRYGCFARRIAVRGRSRLLSRGHALCHRMRIRPAPVPSGPSRWAGRRQRPRCRAHRPDRQTVRGSDKGARREPR